MKVKFIYQLFIFFIFFLTCTSGKKDQTTITLSNNSEVDLKQKAVSIKKDEIKIIPEETVFPLLITEKGDTIPCQLDDTDGDKLWDNLFFVVDITSGEKITLILSWIDESITYSPQTSVRFGKREAKDLPVKPLESDTLNANEVHAALGYQPYQTDGPSWENDKVGFRHYFDGRNAKDFFGKKVSYMSPDSVGINAEGAVEDNYHVMHEWGRDVLAVGNSVGIGGIGFMIGDSIRRLGIVQGDTLNNIGQSVFSILTEGPVHSVISFQYNNWTPDDRSYNVKEKADIWPGIYGYRNEVSISGLQGDETLLAGLVKINTEKELTEIRTKEHVILYTHDQQTYDKVWYLGMALVLPADAYLGNGRAPEAGKFTKTYFAKLKAENEKPVSYYAIACWELSDEGFRDEAYFNKYLLDFVKQLETDVEITIQ